MSWWIFISICFLCINVVLLIALTFNHFKRQENRDSRLIQMDYLQKKYGLPQRCYVYHEHTISKDVLASMWLIDKKSSSCLVPIKAVSEYNTELISILKRQLYRFLLSLPMHAISDLCVIYTDKKLLKAMSMLSPQKDELDKSLLRQLIALENDGIQICFEPKDYKLEGCREAKKELKK